MTSRKRDHPLAGALRYITGQAADVPLRLFRLRDGTKFQCRGLSGHLAYGSPSDVVIDGSRQESRGAAIHSWPLAQSARKKLLVLCPVEIRLC